MRLQRVGRAVKPWRACGQRSVAECWLTPGQRDALLKRLAALLDPGGDRLDVFRLDPRQKPLLLGCARRPRQDHFLVL